ncbi:HutD family protein [Kineococcus endophyticus]|uniref:HutD family protein n=1 Tax=Kineococcus endophyticus TaxID=1181883 RepID=A0ABV3P2H3_9ACTN
MRTVTYEELPDVPWRNGLGTTREVHRDERWRLSIATITAPGPFSVFPGVDRTVVVARGQLVLTVEGRVHRLGPGDLLRFAGEAAVTAEPDGDVTAVNVMTTRPHEAQVRVGVPEQAVVAVDLSTLQSHVAVAAGDLARRAVVVEAVS